MWSNCRGQLYKSQWHQTTAMECTVCLLKMQYFRLTDIHAYMFRTDLFRHKYDRNDRELWILQHPLLLTHGVAIFDFEVRVSVHMAEICLEGFVLRNVIVARAFSSQTTLFSSRKPHTLLFCRLNENLFASKYNPVVFFW